MADEERKKNGGRSEKTEGRRPYVLVNVGYQRTGKSLGETLEEIKSRLALSEGRKIVSQGEDYTVLQTYPFYVLCRDRQGRLCGLLYQDIERGRIPCR